MLSEDSGERKRTPIASGVLDYFPDALAEIAKVSWHGNEKHNAGEPLHWAREKSTDHDDCIIRHFLQRGQRDKEGLRHSAMMAWRALAYLQLEIEADRNRAVTFEDAEEYTDAGAGLPVEDEANPWRAWRPPDHARWPAGPVSGETRVEVRFRSGATSVMPAGNWSWAFDTEWNGLPNRFDIIAWRYETEPTE